MSRFAILISSYKLFDVSDLSGPSWKSLAQQIKHSKIENYSFKSINLKSWLDNLEENLKLQNNNITLSLIYCLVEKSYYNLCHRYVT